MISEVAIAAAAGLGAGALSALTLRRLTIGLLTARRSPGAVAGMSLGLRVVLALAAVLALRCWGVDGAGAGALGYWCGTMVFVGRASAERSR